MRRIDRLLPAALLLAMPATAWGAPPALPDAGAGEAGPAPAADPAAEPAADPAAGDVGAAATDPAAADPFGEPAAPPPTDANAGASGEVDAGFSFDDDSFADTSSSLDAEAGGAGSDASEASSAALDDDPGIVRGRREPMMNTFTGGVGLFHTALPEVGGDKTFRFRMHTDFFRTKGMFLQDEAAGIEDTHARMRGAVNIGFTPIKYMELWFAVNSSSNRNDRDKAGRQDPPTIFALGDTEFGAKGAYRFKNGGIGLGGQMYMGLISGSGRLLTERVNFGFDAIVGVDLRYLTAKKAPVRFAFNLGWLLDNSSKLVDWAAVSDPLSREILRFGLGANNSRVRTKLSMDFPMRLGKERQFGIDPMIEFSWDVATQEVDAFRELTESIGSQGLPRTTQFLTLGLRANVYEGLFLDAGVDIGTYAPDFEFGPNVPPYQVILGLGWSFDPKPVIKEVEVAAENDLPLPEPVLDGRIVGVVSDAAGNPMPGVLVRFPGRATNDMVTDASGGFTSYRFSAGEVAVQVQLADGSTIDRSATVVAEQDTRLDIQLEGEAPAAAPAYSVIDGTFTDDQGAGVAATVQITGMGIDEPFSANESGRMAVELPAGEYVGTISAEGFETKTVNFTATGEQVVLQETLTRAAAPDTPNIKASSRSIRLRKVIRYDGDGLASSSHAILDELALFLNASPDYKKIKVGVYTDDRGNPRQRSQARADAVKAYLVGKGVAPDRVEAKGYGDNNPVAVNLTADGRAKNNRTRIRVVEYTGK